MIHLGDLDVKVTDLDFLAKIQTHINGQASHCPTLLFSSVFYKNAIKFNKQESRRQNIFF